MPNSIWPQDNDGQELFNAISSFFRCLELESFFVCAMFLPIEVCTCSREPVPSVSLFPRTLSTDS